MCPPKTIINAVRGVIVLVVMMLVRAMFMMMKMSKATAVERPLGRGLEGIARFVSSRIGKRRSQQRRQGPGHVPRVL